MVALREIAEQTVELPALEADIIKSLLRAPEPEPVEVASHLLVAAEGHVEREAS